MLRRLLFLSRDWTIGWILLINLKRNLLQIAVTAKFLTLLRGPMKLRDRTLVIDAGVDDANR